MALTKYRLGELIEQTYRQNTKRQYGKDDVCGMTITKEIISTKADVDNTDLSKYLIVYPNEFIYNPRTHGKKIGLGFNDANKNFIISWNNIAFRISDFAHETILPEYLYLHFNRSEWDRQACFSSWGSSTEVFSWDALCDMEILLPSVEAQRKYVDIYRAMTANQKAYEKGLADLKLVCDGFIEDLRRNMPCEKIGKYIEQSDARNDAGLGLESVRGISIQKSFIETKADMDGVPLRSYLLVKPDCFAYVPTTSRNGGKITIAHNISSETYIVSSSYMVFSVSRKDVLLPNYLFMYFNRSEFDRYARYNSWGSARETFDWEEMRNVAIPIPDIHVQRSIADIYNQYIARKEISEKLRARIKDICPVLIKGSLEEA